MRGVLVGMNRAVGFVSRREDFTQGWKDGSGRGNVGLTLYGAICVCMFVLHEGKERVSKERTEEQRPSSTPHPPANISSPQYRLCARTSILTLVFKLAGQIYSSHPFK